jgi:hypothetical protein
LFECTVITDNHSTLNATHEHILSNNYCANVLQLYINQNLKLINCMCQSLIILIFTKLFKKLPAFNGIQLPITIFTTAHNYLHLQSVICCPRATDYSTIFGISGTMVCWILSNTNYEAPHYTTFYSRTHTHTPSVLPLGIEVNFHTYSKDRLKFSSVYLNPNVFRLQAERQKL